jgi:uncharacterized protein YqgC (DUF456 family)
MDFFFLIAIAIGLLLLVVGFVGCIIPALPGPPLGFLALLLLKFAEPTIFTNDFLITMAVITGIVYLLDYLLPIMGAKIYNASKLGIWGAILGMIIGIFFFPPFGMIFGLLFGTIVGELISGKPQKEAVKIGLVSFIFSLLTIIIKVALLAVMSYYFIEAILGYFL